MKYRADKLQLSDKVYRNVEDLEQLDRDFNLDVLITGSDQIWNVNMTDFSEAFFLPFETKARKVSYAASLGGMVQIPDGWKERVKLWLESFSAISVREPSGAETLSEVTDEKVPVLCDPTLLHDSAFWRNEAGERKVQEPYIFFYSWAYPDYEMNSLVQRFAKEKNMPVYVINSSKWYRFRPEKFAFRLYEQSGPEAFLNLMAHAEYVFVQSFHGVVFANLLQKKFCFLNEQIGHVDFRAGNFLEMLHEETQIVHSYDEIEKAFASELTYQSEELTQLIEASKEYLRKQL